MSLVEHYIRNIKKFKDSSIVSIDPIKHGTINQNYIVSTDQNKYFVRINNTNVAGINRENESAILNKLSKLNIIPKIFENNIEKGYLILEYLPLKHWTKDNCIHNQSSLLKILSLVHQIDLPIGFPQLLSRLDDYEYNSRGFSSKKFRKRYHNNKQILNDLGFFEINKLVHFDLNSRNILGVDPLYLIDWEFAGAAHPIFDLALFVYYNKLKTHQYTLIINYCNQYENGDKILKYAIKLAKHMTKMWEMIQNKSPPQ